MDLQQSGMMSESEIE